jgi:hypothetical protein
MYGVGKNWPPNLNRLCPSSRGCEVAKRQGVELAVGPGGFEVANDGRELALEVLGSARFC